MSEFSIQDEIGRRLLSQSGIHVIHKVTRAGATISLVKNSFELGKKTVVIEPTIRLINEITNRIPSITTSKPKMASILSNFEMCRMLPQQSQMKFLFRPGCKNCEYNSSVDCKFQEVLLNDFDTYFLTNQKLRALQLTPSEEAKKLLEKLVACDVFILDEFTKIVITNQPVFKYTKTDTVSTLQNLRNQFSNIPIFGNARNRLKASVLMDTIDIFIGQIAELEAEGVYANNSANTLSDDELKACFVSVWDYTSQLARKNYDTAALQNLLLLTSFRNFILTIDGQEFTITAKVDDALDYLRNFVEKIDETKSVYLVDAYQPQLNHLSAFKRPITHVYWGENGDPLDTSLQQLIIADTAHWGARDFERDKKLRRRIERFMKSLVSKFPAERFLVVTTNKRISSIISRWNLPMEVKITWFRSDLMRGLPIKNKRIMLCIGGPYLPKKSYLTESKSFKFEDFINSIHFMSEGEKSLRTAQILRIDDTRSEFVNAIGRVKDPLANYRSLVLTFGMQKPEVETMLKQAEAYKVAIPHILQPFQKGGFMKDASVMAKIWLNNVGLLKNIEDLSLIARIVRITEEKEHVRASEIVSGKTKLVLKTARRNYDILQHCGIRLWNVQGGRVFEKRQ